MDDRNYQLAMKHLDLTLEPPSTLLPGVVVYNLPDRLLNAKIPWKLD